MDITVDGGAQLRAILPADLSAVSKTGLEAKLGAAVGDRLWSKRVLWLPHMPAEEVSKLGLHNANMDCHPTRWP